ncbi:MAG: hypothetical protein OXC10_10145 [Rhodospirillaceae bacterium]|nr:hypothetical protein [Rhodospirillaceae bacterium]
MLRGLRQFFTGKVVLRRGMNVLWTNETDQPVTLIVENGNYGACGMTIEPGGEVRFIIGKRRPVFRVDGYKVDILEGENILILGGPAKPPETEV